MEKFEIIGSAFLLFGIALLAYFIWEKKRTSKLRMIAQGLGLDFAEEDVLTLIPGYEDFSLMSKGHGRKIINRMSGVSAYGEPVLFGYKYTTGSGKNSSTYSQTVAWIRFKRALPDFEMKPENLLHKIADVIGYPDIDFRDRPGFSKQYHLKGDDASGELSSLFSHLVTGYFEEHEGLCIEVRGTNMLIYFNNRRIKVDEIPVFYKQARNIYSLFYRGTIENDIDASVSRPHTLKPYTAVLYFIVLVMISFFLVQYNAQQKQTTRINQNEPSALLSGWDAFQQQDYPRALKLHSEHIDSKPGDSQGYFYRGLTYEKLHQYDEALDDFQQALSLDPVYFDAIVHIDYLLARHSRFEDIIKYWDDYIARKKNDGRAYLERGGAYRHAGKQQLAIADVKKACDLGNQRACSIASRY